MLLRRNLHDPLLLAIIVINRIHLMEMDVQTRFTKGTDVALRDRLRVLDLVIPKPDFTGHLPPLLSNIHASFLGWLFAPACKLLADAIHRFYRGINIREHTHQDASLPSNR